MRRFVCNDWHTRAELVTNEPGCYVGIAIGPESHEGLVRVNGVLLQAGRVLPLAASEYKIERVVGKADTFAATTRLELVLFEHREELACNVARPNGRFTGDSDTGDLTVPFTGRRHAMVLMHSALAPDAAATYVIYGGRYVANRDTIELVTITSGNLDDTEVAVHVGGTDNAECWDALVVSVTNSGKTYIDVDTIGEIGA